MSLESKMESELCGKERKAGLTEKFLQLNIFLLELCMQDFNQQEIQPGLIFLIAALRSFLN